MAAQPVTHPSADVLKAFALGKLNDSSSEVVLSHLDQCQTCREEVTAVSGDDFLNRLRQAQGRSVTPAPAKPLGDVPRAPQPPVQRTPIANLPPELAANQQYEILRELGRGGMGVVYLAKNKLMDRLEVLKVVNKALLDRPAAVERFLREIRSAAKLSHANVVGAYSAVQMGELLAFAMEYVEGQDLASLVKSQGPLPIPHACFYLQQAALGLQHAFEKQMVHRDIKPQNLILAREGSKHIVKVLDFGLAKLRREKKDDTGLTGEGKMLGTPDYIAPEQTLDAAKADIRADIYSLGCTLYFLLSGQPPFSASSLGGIVLAHQMHEAKPLNLVRPEVPEELAALVRKMMAKIPDKRYQTPLAVVQALAPFVKQGAPPKQSPELSSGGVEAMPVIKKTAPVNPLPISTTKDPKKQPNVANECGSPVEGSIVSVGSDKSGVVSKHPDVTVRERKFHKKWVIGSIGAGVLLLAMLGIWARGKFEAKTLEIVLTLEVNEPNSEVFVDGEKLAVSSHDGGKKAEIRVRPGTRTVEVKKLVDPDFDSLFSFRKAGWQNDAAESLQLQADLFRSLEKLCGKADNRSEIISVAKNLRKRAQSDRGRLLKQREILAKEAKKNHEEVEIPDESQCFKQLGEYEQALAQFITKQEEIAKTENDQQWRKWRTELQNAKMLEKELEYGKAVDIYERIRKEGYRDAESDKHLAKLHEVWDPRDPEHKEARGFIYRVWPTFDTARLKSDIAKTRRAFQKCKEIGDFISLLKLLEGNEAHAERLHKVMNQLLPDFTIEDAKEAAELKKVSEQIVMLNLDIEDYLKAHADDIAKVGLPEAEGRDWTRLKKRQAQVPEPPSSGDKKGVERGDPALPPAPKPRPLRRVIRVEEADDPKAFAMSEAELLTGPMVIGDVAQLAKQATHPTVKTLFHSLAVPYDRVLFKSSSVTVNGRQRQRKERIEPSPLYYGDNPSRFQDARLRFTPLTRDGKPDKPFSVDPLTLESVRPFEEIAQSEVRQFLKETYDQRDRSDPLHPSRSAMLLAAEQALSAVLRWHESAIQANKRTGEKWDDVGKRLRKQLLDEVLLEQMKLHCLGKDWDRTLELTHRLAKTYGNSHDLEPVFRPVSDMIERSFKEPTFSEEKKRQTRKRLHELEMDFPDNSAIRSLKDTLRKASPVGQNDEFKD